MGRKKAEFDKKTFVDLVGLGCNQQEICWYFRDNTGKPANIDTLSRWCKREFKLTFHEYKRLNGGVARNIQLRKKEQVKMKCIQLVIWTLFLKGLCHMRSCL
jgi:hypothetical protein